MLDRQEPRLLPSNVFQKSGPIANGESPFKDSAGYIVSVHYNSLTFQSRYVNLHVTLQGLTYADVVRGVVSVAQIPDCVEFVRTGDLESPKLHRGIDLARAFVNDHLQAIVGVNLSLAQPILPGIAVSETPVPTRDLFDKIIADQQRYCNSMIEAGTTLHVQHQQRLITDDHRRAAAYMNVEAVYTPKAYGLGDIKACIACAESIKSAAVMCRYCGSPQDQAALNRNMAAKYDAMGAPPIPPPTAPQAPQSSKR